MNIDMSKSLEIFGEEAQMAAVLQDNYALQYIDNPSEAVQLAAASWRAACHRLRRLENLEQRYCTDALRLYVGLSAGYCDLQ